MYRPSNYTDEQWEDVYKRQLQSHTLFFVIRRGQKVQTCQGTQNTDNCPLFCKKAGEIKFFSSF